MVTIIWQRPPTEYAVIASSRSSFDGVKEQVMPAPTEAPRRGPWSPDDTQERFLIVR